MTIQARHQGVLILLNLITTVSVSAYTMSLHTGEYVAVFHTFHHTAR